jgi:hypothetical protein
MRTIMGFLKFPKSKAHIPCGLPSIYCLRAALGLRLAFEAIKPELNADACAKRTAQLRSLLGLAYNTNFLNYKTIKGQLQLLTLFELADFRKRIQSRNVP